MLKNSHLEQTGPHVQLGANLSTGKNKRGLLRDAVKEEKKKKKTRV